MSSLSHRSSPSLKSSATRRSVHPVRRVAEGSAFCMSTINRLGWRTRTSAPGASWKDERDAQGQHDSDDGLGPVARRCTSSTAPALTRAAKAAQAAAVQAEAAAKAAAAAAEKAEAAAQAAARAAMAVSSATYCSASQLAVELGPLTPRWATSDKSSASRTSRPRRARSRISERGDARRCRTPHPN